MAEIKTGRFCKTCKKRVLHTAQRFSGGMGCLLTILTGGLFLLFWIPIMLIDMNRAWVCNICGTKRYW